MDAKALKAIRRKESELIEKMKDALPPVIARKHVGKFLGGMISSNTLANADSAGEGPGGAYRVGNSVIYRTGPLLDWIVVKYGVTPIINSKNL